MSRDSPGQQKEPGSGEGGRPGSDQMPPPIDVDAIARGFGPQGPILLNEMVHGVFDAFIPVFLLLGPPRARRQQFCLCFDLPHRGQCGVTAALWLFTLDTEDGGCVRNPGRATRRDGQPGQGGSRRVRGEAKAPGARSWGPGASVPHGEGRRENTGTADVRGQRHRDWGGAAGRPPPGAGEGPEASSGDAGGAGGLTITEQLLLSLRLSGWPSALSPTLSSGCGSRTRGRSQNRAPRPPSSPLPPTRPVHSP